MMNRRIIKRPKARRDLIDHFVFIARDNPAAAERFLKAMEETFENLAAMPESGRSWESVSPALAGLRVSFNSRFRNYLIFYRPIRDGIEVITVLHAARDLETILESVDVDRPDDEEL